MTEQDKQMFQLALQGLRESGEASTTDPLLAQRLADHLSHAGIPFRSRRHASWTIIEITEAASA